MAALLAPELGWTPEQAADQAGRVRRRAPQAELTAAGIPARWRTGEPMTTPTPPTPVDGEPAAVTDRLGGQRVATAGALLEHLAASGVEVRTGDEDRIEAGRDWWPLAIAWAARGQVPARPADGRPAGDDRAGRSRPRRLLRPPACR